MNEMKFVFENELINHEPFCGEKVLLVDDNDLNLEVVRILLQDQGLLVDTVNDGEEAVRYYQKSEEFEYRMIFLDINMYGMNGYDTAKAIRNTGRRDSKWMAVYAMSANIMEEHRIKAKEAGMDGYVLKPIDYKDLFRMMHDVFRRQSISQGEYMDEI